MTPSECLQILIFFIILLTVTKPMGIFMSHVYQGERTLLSPVFIPFETIPMLVPLALKGTSFRPMPAERLLVHNLLIYGVGVWLCRLRGLRSLIWLLG